MLCVSQVFRSPAQSEMVFERKLHKINADVLKQMKISTGDCCSVVTVSKFIEQSLLDLFHMMFPQGQVGSADHRLPEVLENSEKNEILVSIDANFSTNENRQRFLREVERELEALSSSSAAILLQVRIPILIVGSMFIHGNLKYFHVTVTHSEWIISLGHLQRDSVPLRSGAPLPLRVRLR